MSSFESVFTRHVSSANNKSLRFILYLKCGVKTNWMTSKLASNHTSPGNPPYDINRRAAFATSEIGLGREGFTTFCGIMGMPLPSDTMAWYSQIKAVNNAANSEFNNCIQQAAVRLRSIVEIENDDVDHQFDPKEFSQCVDVAVSFDGTWHHRGFKSSHGVGVVMSVDTGEVLDAHILSKDCSICAKNSGADDEWKKHHIESGQCEKNCEGPSTSMETEAAKVMWLRSKERGLRYTTVLSDGDNKTIAALKELKPYGNDGTINKLDCVNHVHKRMGAGLRLLLKSNKEVKGGKGGLTAKKIDYMASFYRKAIMDNCTTSKDSAEINKSVQNMQRRILANLHHSVYHPDPSIQHKFCDSWCPFVQDQEDGTSTYDHEENRKKRLPQSFLPHLLPLYERLSDTALLMRCVAGLAQNQNEGFNATIWKRCPKERAFSASSVKRAVHLAAISWNCGNSCYENMLHSLGLGCNYFTKKVMNAKNNRRLSEAANYDVKKLHIKRKHKEKNQTERKAKYSCGDDYQPGMF